MPGLRLKRRRAEPEPGYHIPVCNAPVRNRFVPHRLLCLLTSVLLCAGCALQPAPLQADADAIPTPPSAPAQPNDPEPEIREKAEDGLPEAAAEPSNSAPADPVTATSVEGDDEADDGGDAIGRDLSPRQRAQVQFQVMAGEMAAGRNQPGLAAEAFLRALELAPDAELAARTTQLALGAGRYDVGESAARRWLEIDPTALEAREVLARLALQTGAEEAEQPLGVEDDLERSQQQVGRVAADLDPAISALLLLALSLFPFIVREIAEEGLGISYDPPGFEQLQNHVTRLLQQGIAP